LDIKAVDEKGQHYNIELQVQPEEFYIPRSLYYVSGLYFKQLNKGEGYDCLRRTIGISILDFELFKGQPGHLQSVFRLKDTQRAVEFTDILELMKLPKPLNLETPLLRWLGDFASETVFNGLVGGISPPRLHALLGWEVGWSAEGCFELGCPAKIAFQGLRD
jgi:hypothetical protein